MDRLKLPSKILTPYGDSVKNFRFLKEAKILSEFFRSRLALGMPSYYVKILTKILTSYRNLKFFCTAIRCQNFSHQRKAGIP